MTISSDNIYPKLILVEGAAPSSPAATNFKLYFDSSDHLLKWKNSAGTVTTVGTAAGLSDPMTTRGDVIVRNASNVTARLGIGSSGKVLQSDGTDISWQTPAAGGGLLGVASVGLGADQTTSSSTPVVVDAGLSVTFTAPASGNVLVQMFGMFAGSSGFNFYWVALEGSTNMGEAAMWSGGSTINPSIPTTASVYITGLSAGSHTFKFAHRTNGGGTTKVIALTPTVISVWAAP